MIGDTANVSARYISKRFKIPSYSRIEALLDAKNFSQEAVQLASPFLSDAKDLGQRRRMKNYFDLQLSKNLDELIACLSHGSFAYDYLALSEDIAQLHSFYQAYFEHHKPYTKSSLTNIINRMRVLFTEKDAILALDARIHSFSTSFSFFAQLDGIYFRKLISAAEGRNEFIRTFIGKLIDSFNISTLVRMRLLKKNKDAITKVLVQNPWGIDPKNLLSKSEAEVLFSYLGLQESVSLDTLSRVLKTRELKFLSQGIFSGLGEESLLLYIEILRTFFYDLKLLALYHELGSQKEDIKAHLVNYDLKL